ncbi:MAG: hypothetical protein K0S67_1035 [Nitrososphaeraceae archaeon]|jgi:hypothetical protein|nr:hypothetical protein [Nitrososphaeraceae archaeon]MCD6037147.1 hypothetical protein [Nitrososphaeraceae archaeon]MDF2767809.1 hypothetical protein [Nitrososphaeraceae archaeon]
MDGKSHTMSSSKGTQSTNNNDTTTTLRKRYNKLVIINLQRRAMLRNMVKQNTQCEHKQIYTQANAICRRISSSYEEDRISIDDAVKLMIEAHNQMSHSGLPKDVVAAEMNKRLNKIEKGETGIFEVTMANVSSSNLIGKKDDKTISEDQEGLNRYSESYWSEII